MPKEIVNNEIRTRFKRASSHFEAFHEMFLWLLKSVRIVINDALTHDKTQLRYHPDEQFRLSREFTVIYFNEFPRALKDYNHFKKKKTN